MLHISDYKKKKIFNNSRKILDAFHIKMPIYNFLITLSQELALNKLKKIFKSSSSLEKKSSGKKIVFNNVHGTYLEAIYKEAGLAKALQLRGHNIKMLLCAGALTGCTGLFTINIPPNTWMCKNCNHFSKHFFEIVDLAYATYFEYLKREDINDIKNKVDSMSLEECKNLVHKGVNVGFHTMTSVQRFYKGSDPSDSKYRYDDIFRSRLVNAIISVEVAEKVIKKEKPDILVTSHGCYSSWGPFRDYFVNHGIRVCVWGTGYKPNTLHFEFDKIGENFPKYLKEINNKRSLNKKQDEELQIFLKGRMSGEEGDTSLYGFSTSANKSLEMLFDKKKYEKTYVMFPNLPWDASLVNADQVFNDVYEWVSYTIELFKEKPHLQLIIKIHPAEKLIHTSKMTLEDYINNTFSSLHENIKILSPETKFSPYSLFPYIDVGIVYNGTIGLEMSLNDIPVVVTAKAHYSGHGFTNDVSSKKEYAAMLFDKQLHQLSKEKRDLVKLYSYYYFIKTYVPLKILYYKNFLNHGWNIRSFDDLAKGKDRYLDHMCDYIANNSTYQNW